LIDSIVALINPQAGETVQDPAAGTAGFLIAADAWIKAKTDNLYDLNEKQRTFQRNKAFIGMELVPGTRRLALMNCLLHGMEGDAEGVVHLGNTLGSAGSSLPKSDIILSNPPFGTAKGGGGPTRDDFTTATSNKQLAFVQHIVRHLKDGGRAAVVLPDNVLFEAGVGADIRRDLMDKCNLHTLLRLPTGIFYAQGVKTNVLFFDRSQPARHRQHQGSVGLRPARQHAQVRQAHAAHPRPLRRIRSLLLCWRRKRWGNWKERWRNCRRFWRSWVRWGNERESLVEKVGSGSTPKGGESVYKSK
jgi:type I restriction-modification system DNA methylase subunit